MFTNFKENIRMLKGSYKKLKSYYYYNKNFLLVRRKIADFESNQEHMESVFNELAEALLHPLTIKSKTYILSLLNAIDFYVLPKKFDTQEPDPNYPVSNTIQRDKKLKSVNFFIDAPIEIHILDTLWTIFLAKMDNDNHVLLHNVYGNTINYSALFGLDNFIAFDSIVLFNRYFPKYTAWRDEAFHYMELINENGNDALLVSLDIKSYFYSVCFNFNKLNDYFSNHELLKKIRPLTRIINQVYNAYLGKIYPYRKDMDNLSKDEFPLPLGMFSSMFIGNIYLNDFDNKVIGIKGLAYYGRYVDDILIVVKKTIEPNTNNITIIDELFVKNKIFIKKQNHYVFSGYKSLNVQNNKIKTLYIDHNESKALIDIYNKTIRILPSEVEPLPFSYIENTNFDEVAYTIENFTKENKVRDFSFIGIDSFKVGKYFSLLPRKVAHINIKQGKILKLIKDQLVQIKKFFTGSQTIEFYSNWLNYMYFLVIINKSYRLNSFLVIVNRAIKFQNYTVLDSTIYNDIDYINEKLRKTLTDHLNICLDIALSIDIVFAKRNFPLNYNSSKKYINSNMFEHAFVAFPLANYLEYSNDISYCKMSLYEIGNRPKNLSSFYKFLWSPRFIHYDELLLLEFYNYHSNNIAIRKNKYDPELMVKEFTNINNLWSIPFNIDKKEIFNNNEYFLDKVIVSRGQNILPEKVNVAIGSINVSPEKCIKGYERWDTILLEDKELLYKILEETYNCFENNERGTMVLVLPELYFPFYWISDLIRFSKYTQIAIVTGLQYIGDKTNQKYNYLATILPFKSGNKGYRNAFLHIREKNDYSPIEFIGLAEKSATCKDRIYAEYQVFHWKGIRLSPIICYELTDITIRALLKGNIDILTVPELNKDTNYFSNIIESTARDLHAFIIQANSSYYGDSRVTGPYDRDSKDVFKIKGGDNDHIVIGSLDFIKLKEYQDNYLDYLEKQIQSALDGKNDDNKKEKPEIKRLPARFKINNKKENF